MKAYSILYLNNIKSYNLRYSRTQLWRSDESSSLSSFFFIETELHYSTSGWLFCPHVISHIPIESESRAEQDGIYRF